MDKDERERLDVGTERDEERQGGASGEGTGADKTQREIVRTCTRVVTTPVHVRDGQT